MKFTSMKPWLGAAALVAVASLAWAQIERLTLADMVSKTTNTVEGKITKSTVIRVDDPIDGPELYFTTLTIEGLSAIDGKPLTVDVTFPGGFINPEEGVSNSEAPSADDIEVGNRVVAFFKQTENMGGGVKGNQLYASHGGLYRVIETKNGSVVQGRGEGYAIASNTKVTDLRMQLAKLRVK